MDTSKLSLKARTDSLKAYYCKEKKKLAVAGRLADLKHQNDFVLESVPNGDATPHYMSRKLSHAVATRRYANSSSD
ncbi:unnamed protein product [Arctia plantaginis]|uniref:Uncharacterized protein n=1 Tax=Arctia plantaginis TaxID=874455 RepID=A0A8S0Z3H3_ARCPL|nr:unnamed protein product [Arctia plantaginis]